MGFAKTGIDQCVSIRLEAIKFQYPTENYHTCIAADQGTGSDVTGCDFAFG